MLVDTHCHIHDADYPISRSEVLERARDAGVEKVICVGTGNDNSKRALEAASAQQGVYATIGVHPHYAKGGVEGVLGLVFAAQKPSGLVAVGEIGLDYYYNYSPRQAQIEAFEAQLDLSVRLDLPVSFHVREAFEDFWAVLDNFSGVRGVLHSFTDSQKTLDEALGRGLYIGLNGISTFTKDAQQQEVFAAVPMENMLLETDAPFLTPVPYRGKVNEPAFVREVASHHANIRGVSLEHLASVTSANADTLFGIG